MTSVRDGRSRAYGIRTTFQIYAELRSFYERGKTKKVLRIYESNAKYLMANCEKQQLSAILQKYLEC